MFENIKYKIIQAPMAGNITNSDLVAQICNHGMLGSIAGGYLSLEALANFIQTTKKLTTNPFIVNFFIEEQRKLQQSWPKSLEIIALEKQLGIYNQDTFTEPVTISTDKYIDLLIAEQVALVSCTFGFFDSKIVERLKSAGIKIIGTATTVQEAKYCTANGADAIVLQGAEAGGHQGSFLKNEPNYTTALELLQETQKLKLNLPLISAGGVSPTNMHEYFTNGATCVQLGTLFMMTQESSLPLEVKQFIELHLQTKLTKDITGKWARGVVNKLMQELNGSNIYDFPRQHYATSAIRNAAKHQLNPEYLALWAGSNPDNCQINSLDETITKLVSEYKQI